MSLALPRFHRFPGAVLCLLLLVLALVPNRSNAHPMNGTLTLSELASGSDVIVIAKITAAPKTLKLNLVGDPELPDGPKPPTFFGYPLGDPLASASWPMARVEGQVITCLKGQLTGAFSAAVQLQPSPFEGLGVVHLGDTALVFLSRTGNGWRILDGTVPALRVTPNQAKLSEALADPNAPLLTRLVSLLIASLPDARMRLAYTFYLAPVEDPRLIPALLPYVHDPNLRTRDSVLCCLATNQYLPAIPLIVDLAHLEGKRNYGPPSCLEAIGRIRSPRAIAALNRLLFDDSPMIRMNIMMALRPIADQTSIPFLMVALRDPEPHNMVSYDAYATLLRLSRLPNALRTTTDFEHHRDEITAPIYRWYADTLEAAKSKSP